MKDTVKAIALALVAALALMFFIKPTVVKENSMEPCFEENDYLIVSRQSYGLFGGEPERGDVVVTHSELKTDDGSEKLIIKRVIGTPGDAISVTDGKVYVNGELLDDSYTKDGYTQGAIEDLVVPADTVFCLGDNRGVSLDSRYPEVGFIPEEDIVGKVVLRLWPIDRAGFIDNPYE